MEVLTTMALPVNDACFWAYLSCALSQRIENTEQLTRVLQTCVDRYVNFGNLPGLQCAIQEFDFWDILLPNIQRWALEMPALFKDIGGPGRHALPLLPENLPNVVQFTARQVRCLLAHMFFCTFRTPPDNFGDLRPFRLYMQATPVGVERIKCLLNYFKHAADEQLMEHRISFWREGCATALDTALTMEKLDRATISQCSISHTGSIEEKQGAASIVDFANAKLHIHCVAASATQEEVLFSIFPECFVGVLISETLLDHEAIVIRGARQFNTHTGYQQTFRWAGSHANIANTHPDIIAIDATVNYNNRQFQPQFVRRDTIKAYVGFRAAGAAGLISTGMWGCGAFGGDEVLKFCQQLVAASMVERPLHVTTFGRQDIAQVCGELLQLIMDRHLTAGQVFRAMCQFDPENTQLSFAEHMMAQLTSI